MKTDNSIFGKYGYDSFNRYARITQWARNRYLQLDTLVLSIGYKPSTYSAIESMAARKYLGFTA